MKLLALFICLCLSLANAKPFTNVPFVGTPFVYPPITPGFTQITPQIIPTFRTVATPFSPTPYVFNRFHTQDRTGAYTFAYSGGPSSRTESRDRFGNVVGAFNYVDPEGKIQTQQYLADSTGFRVAGTNLPVQPIVNVKETEKTRTKRETTVGKTPASTTPLKTFPFQQVVPQTYSGVITPQVVPQTYSGVITPQVFPTGITPQVYHTGITPQVYPNVFTNIIPNVYTASKTPVTFPYNAFPTFYTVPTAVPTTDTKFTTDTKIATNEKTETNPVQPFVYSGLTSPYYTYDPNFFTRQVNTQKTPNTGFTYYY